MFLTNASSPMESDLNQTLPSIAASNVWKYAAPFIFIIGNFGNVAIIYILIKIKFWTKLAYSLIFILTLSDTAVLYVGMFRRWMFESFGVDFRNVSDFSCKSTLFLLYFSMHLSSWTLVCVTAERFSKVTFPLRYIAWSGSRKLIVTYLVVTLICFATNSHFFWTNGLVNSPAGLQCNNTSIEYYDFEEKYFSIVDMLLLSVLPFSVILPMNICLFRALRKSAQFQNSLQTGNRNQKRFEKRSKTLTKMLFFTSIYFLLVTLPVSLLFVVESYLRRRPKTSALIKGLKFTTSSLYLLQYSNYAVNFFIYVVINRDFRKRIYIPRFSRSDKIVLHSISGSSDSNDTSISIRSGL